MTLLFAQTEIPLFNIQFQYASFPNANHKSNLYQSDINLFYILNIKYPRLGCSYCQCCCTTSYRSIHLQRDLNSGLSAHQADLLIPVVVKMQLAKHYLAWLGCWCKPCCKIQRITQDIHTFLMCVVSCAFKNLLDLLCLSDTGIHDLSRVISMYIFLCYCARPLYLYADECLYTSHKNTSMGSICVHISLRSSSFMESAAFERCATRVREKVVMHSGGYYRYITISY